jgi:hypothetical protein
MVSMVVLAALLVLRGSDICAAVAGAEGCA